MSTCPIREAHIISFSPKGKQYLDDVVLMAGLAELGIPFKIRDRRRFRKGRVCLDEEILVAGDLLAVEQGLLYSGGCAPLPDDYPICLRHYLRRDVREMTYGQACRCAQVEGEIFVKPRVTVKLFDGFVMGRQRRPKGVWKGAVVWVADAVEMRSEHRAIILDGQVVSWWRKKGQRIPLEAEARCMLKSCREAATQWAVKDNGPVAFGLDWAWSDGAPILVEANHILALGAYGASPKAYAVAVITQWAELTGRREQALAWVRGLMKSAAIGPYT